MQLTKFIQTVYTINVNRSLEAEGLELRSNILFKPNVRPRLVFGENHIRPIPNIYKGVRHMTTHVYRPQFLRSICRRSN